MNTKVVVKEPGPSIVDQWERKHFDFHDALLSTHILKNPWCSCVEMANEAFVVEYPGKHKHE